MHDPYSICPTPSLPPELLEVLDLGRGVWVAEQEDNPKCLTVLLDFEDGKAISLFRVIAALQTLTKEG